MGEHSLSARMQQKIDTAANWAKATNFVPKKGEIIVYSDGGGVGIPKIKVGDGTTKVGSLKFIESDGKLPAGRKISLGTAVSSTPTEFDGSKDITIPVNSVSASYLSWGGKNIVGGISLIDAAMSYLHNPNRLQFANPAGITIEYSNDGGSTWLDYEAADQQKIGLVSGLNTIFYYGKRTSSDVTATTNDKLRITLDGFKIKCYTMLKTILINFSTEGASGCKVLVERALFDNQTSFETIGTYALDGWSGWNSIPWERSGFGGYEHQSNNTRIIRLTFSASGIISTSSPRVFNIMFLGTTYWDTPSNMARTGHIYDWDTNQNAIFPAGITATSFNGPASKVANSLTLNGKSFDGSSAVSLSSQQLGVPSAFIAKSVSVLDCNNEKIGRVLSSSATNSLINGPLEIGSTGAGVLWNIPLSAPTSSINEAGTQQKLYQIFVYDSGKLYLRKNSSNDTATWTYGTWEKLLTDVNITADNITTALGYAPVKDVQVAGSSVMADGVANIKANPYQGVSFNSLHEIVLFPAGTDVLNPRVSNRAITPTNLDYAVTAAMTDGKGPAWTAAQRAAARDRMGIPGDYELIEEIVLTEESRVARSKEPDGAPYNFATIMMRAEFPASDKTGNIYISYNIGNEYNNIISYFLSPYKADAVKYGYSKVWVENSRYRSGWWTCVENHGQFAQYYENPMQQDKYSIADGNIISFSTDVMAAGTKITIYGVRA